MGVDLLDNDSPMKRLKNLKISRERRLEKREQAAARLDQEDRDADSQIAELEALVRAELEAAPPGSPRED